MVLVSALSLQMSLWLMYAHVQHSYFFFSDCSLYLFVSCVLFSLSQGVAGTPAKSRFPCAIVTLSDTQIRCTTSQVHSFHCSNLLCSDLFEVLHRSSCLLFCFH